MKVFVAIPTTGTVADMHSFFWRNAEKNYAGRLTFQHPEKCVRRVFHDFARNALVDEFLASDCDVLFFLDSDVVPPDNVFDLLLTEKPWTIAGAPYPVFMTPPGYKRPQVLFTAYKQGPKGLYAAEIPSDGQEYIEGLATGCLFIKREVFADLARPYFEHKYDEKSRQMTEGEDLGFCRRVGEKGHKFLVDYSMVCKHYKSVCLLEVNNYAIEYSRRSIEKYDAQVKGQVGALISRLTAKEKAPKVETFSHVPSWHKPMINARK